MGTPAATGPRIPPGDRRDVGWFTWLLSQGAGIVGRSAPPALFLTLGRHRPLFRAWLRFGNRLMLRGRLPRRETELVILRVAHLRDSRYEFEHHVRLGRRAGLDAADIDRITARPDAPGWPPRERLLLTAVDELHHTGDLSDDTWAALRSHLDERDIIELVMLAAHYEMLATVIATLRLVPDPPRRRRV